MSYPLPLTRTEAYLAYKAGVIQQSELKPSLAVPRIGIDAWLAYWTQLANDYPKNPDGTPMILQEEEAYIAYLCGVIDTYPEKCLRRVGAYLRYIISARWGRPDHPLNREELYLSLIKTQFIPSGDPSSDITIDGTAKAAFVDVKMYGDTSQQTYSGKNLFDRENYGTLVGWAAQGEIKNYGNRVFYIQCKPGTTYTIQKMLAKPVERSRCQIFTTSDVPAVGVSVIGILFSTNDATQATFTTQSSANYLCIVCYEAVASTETTVQEMADSIMIEEGATASPYEPYVGGQPSPNPDYPQAIKTVTGLQTVEVQGKNLFDGVFELGNISTTTGANIEVNTMIRTKNYCEIKPDTQYTISVVGGGNIALRFYQADGTFIGTGTTGASPNTFTSPADAGRVRFVITSNTNLNTKAQCEAGSSATTWTPYSKHTHEINLGKNLFDKSKQVSGWLNSTGGISQPTSTTDKTSDYMTCSPNTSYTLSSSGYYLKIAQYDANKAFVKLDQSGNNIPSLTVNTDGNAAYIRISYGNADKEPNVQFEAGSAATPYAPYFAPIELCKLGTYQDYIWKDGGDWKVHRANGYYALTDSVSITPGIDTSQPNTTRFQFTNILAEPSSTSGRTSLKCSHFKYASMWNTDVVGIQTADYAQESSNTRFWFRIPKTIATTFNQLKSWLANNTVELYYPLATATDTIITNQPLIAQLEALVAGGAENGTTYIKVNASDPNLPGLLVVEAPKYE